MYGFIVNIACAYIRPLKIPPPPVLAISVYTFTLYLSFVSSLLLLLPISVSFYTIAPLNFSPRFPYTSMLFVDPSVAISRALIYSKHVLMSSARTLVVSGGVACNEALRARLNEIGRKHDFRTVFPPSSLCSDNGAMIAWAGVEYYRAGRGVCDDPDKLRFHPQWPIWKSVSEE